MTHIKPFRYSTISDYYRCPTFYKLKHIDGLDDGLNKSADISFGTAVHLGMQDLFEGGDGITVFKLYWSMEEAKGLQSTRYGHADLMKIGTALLEIFRDEHMKKFSVNMLEQKMTAELGEHTFSGTADFVGEYNRVLSIVDWKTSAMPYDQYKLTYNEQLYGYAYLVKKALGLDIKQIVYGVAVKDDKNPRWQFRTAPLEERVLKEKMDNVELSCSNIKGTKVFSKNPLECVRGKRPCAFFNVCYGAKNEKDEKA